MAPRGVIVTKENPIIINGKKYYSYVKINGVEIDRNKTVEVQKGSHLQVRMWCINNGDTEGYFVLKLIDKLNNETLYEHAYIASPGGHGWWDFYEETITKSRHLEIVLDTYYYTKDPKNPRGKYVCTDRYG